MGKKFPDESNIIHVNSSIQDDTELGHLMHDFHCKSAEDIHNIILAKRVFELKGTEKGVEIMCREMDAVFNEGAERGRTEGIAEGISVGKLEQAKETAYELYDEDRFSPEKITKRVKVSADTVKRWLAERPVTV